MNCVERLVTAVADHPNRCAIWMPDGSQISFGELASRAGSVQAQLRRLGLVPGEPVLILLGLGFDLYASVIALMASGYPVLLVEPWMPLHRIERILQQVQPRAFLTSSVGRLWGLRSSAIRAIPHWVSPQGDGAGSGSLQIEDVEPTHHGILTFTSGTTGDPKGVVRSHGYLWDQHTILEANLHPVGGPSHGGADWCIFANFTLANLGSGRTTVLMPPSWRTTDFRAVAELSGELAPKSMTCGPAFLSRLLESGFDFHSLDSIHVGGALTDCSLFEDAFQSLPGAIFLHVYGSTEAEPVATMDARRAVADSRAAGFLQTLCLGNPVPEIRLDIEGSRLWVSGAHVCPRYLGGEAENRLHKRTDSAGISWHNMGDRVKCDSEGRLWYAGRSGQSVEEFRLEQEVYAVLGHTSAFLHRDSTGMLWLVGEHVVAAEARIRKSYPEIRYIEDAAILRDHRHRARIDRSASLKKGAPWLVG